MSEWQLPHSWELVRLGDLAKTTSGGTPRRDKPSYFGGPIPWVKSGELRDRVIYETDETISEEGLASSSAKVFPKGTVCIALYGATVGKLGILGIDAATNQAVCAIFVPNRLDSYYLYRFLEAKRPDLIHKGKGGAQSNISQAIIRDTAVPLPPLPEQRRIVAEIEKQLTRLEAGVGALKRVQSNLKRYRAAVQKVACEGRLVFNEAEFERRTAKGEKSAAAFETGEQLLARILAARRSEWQGRGKLREPSAPDATKLPAPAEGWTWATVEQLSTKVTDGTHFTPNYVSHGVAFISVKDIRAGRIHFDDCRFITVESHHDLFKRCNPQRGDVLVTKSGTIGRLAVVNTDRPFSLFVSVALIKPLRKMLDPEFLKLALEAYIASIDISQDVKGALLKNLHLEDLRVVPIPLPPLVEQKRIVAEVERRLSVVDQLETVVEANLQRARHLRQSILQRAFSGNL